MANNDPRRHTRLLLLSQFKSRVSPRSSRFQWPSDRSLLEAQSFVLADLFQDQSQSQSQSQASSHSTASVAYQKIFLKELINRIDRAIASLSDEQDEWVSGVQMPCLRLPVVVADRDVFPRCTRKRMPTCCNTTLTS